MVLSVPSPFAARIASRSVHDSPSQPLGVPSWFELTV